jgi:Family of unknown function (DUF5995)
VEEIGTPGVGEVLSLMQPLLDRYEASGDPRRFFLATYRRTTQAVGEAVRDARFEDPAWVDRWDLAFARLYLDALVQYEDDPALTPRPWRLALGANGSLHPLQHVLLGMNAHINLDLPQALLSVIDVEEFSDARLMARRQRDHERIDAVLAQRVAAEDRELKASELHGGLPRRTPLDHALQPVNRAASRRFLTEARRKVWRNANALQEARIAGPGAYARRLGELDVLASARIADLLQSRNVLLRLAINGFGVVLPPP